MLIQFIDKQDGKIAYDDAVNGPVVICIPSMGDLRSECRFLIPQIVRSYS